MLLHIGWDRVYIRLVGDRSGLNLRERGVVGTQECVRSRDWNANAHNVPFRRYHLRRDVVSRQPTGDSLNALLRRRYERLDLDRISALPVTDELPKQTYLGLR